MLSKNLVFSVLIMLKKLTIKTDKLCDVLFHLTAKLLPENAAAFVQNINANFQRQSSGPESWRYYHSQTNNHAGHLNSKKDWHDLPSQW